MIYLDFFSGSHGHFLEYVVNTWLFKGPRVKHIFTNTGASHGIRKDLEYMSQRRIYAAHYTEFNIPLQPQYKIVRITLNKHWANWIYQINVCARAGDMPLEKKTKLVPESVRAVSSDFRNDWYSKLNFSNNGYNLPGKWASPDSLSFDFSIESLFDSVNFYTELYRLAAFLETRFVPDQDLMELLNKFLTKNQGWQYYTACKQLSELALANQAVEFSSDEVLQALINSVLSMTVGMFDGELFTCNDYPTNTLKISQLITKHLQTFDQRW